MELRPTTVIVELVNQGACVAATGGDDVDPLLRGI
jgi:hypothetical protein